MELISLLEEKREEIINDAYASIEPVKLKVQNIVSHCTMQQWDI